MVSRSRVGCNPSRGTGLPFAHAAPGRGIRRPAAPNSQCARTEDPLGDWTMDVARRTFLKASVGIGAGPRAAHLHGRGRQGGFGRVDRHRPAPEDPRARPRRRTPEGPVHGVPVRDGHGGPCHAARLTGRPVTRRHEMPKAALEGAARGQCHFVCGVRQPRRRRRSSAAPARPMPSRVIVAGSGVTVTVPSVVNWLKSQVRSVPRAALVTSKRSPMVA